MPFIRLKKVSTAVDSYVSRWETSKTHPKDTESHACLFIKVIACIIEVVMR